MKLLVRNIDDIRKDIDFFINAKQIYKARYYIRELKNAVNSDEEAVMLLNSGAVAIAYDGDMTNARQ